MYSGIFFQIETHHARPGIVFSVRTKQETSIANQVQVCPTPIAAMETLKDALIKGIAQMKEFNERMDKQYPNSVLAYV